MALRTRQATNDEIFTDAVKRLKAKSDNRRNATWDLVDELLACEDVLGERFSQAVEVTRLSSGALSNYLSTGRAWPANLRHLNMPFDMHTALNSLADEQKTAAMTMAMKADWTREELRQRVGAWKAGDTLAFDHRHKVAAPERKVRDVPDSHARVNDDDKPIMDRSAFGGGEHASSERPDFEACNEAQLVLKIASLIEAQVSPQVFARRLSGVTPERLQALASWLSVVATEYGQKMRRAAQEGSRPAPKADRIATKAGADEASPEAAKDDGDVPSSAPSSQHSNTVSAEPYPGDAASGEDRAQPPVRTSPPSIPETTSTLAPNSVAPIAQKNAGPVPVFLRRTHA
jgi:hypothetical protein